MENAQESLDEVIRESCGCASEIDLKRLHSVLVSDVVGPLWTDREFQACWRALIGLPTRDYLDLCDQADEAVVRGLETARDVGELATICSCGSDVLLGLTDRICTRISPIWAFAALHQIFTFPLRFDMPGAVMDWAQIAQINDSRDQYQPSSTLVALARRYIDDEFIDLYRAGFAFQHGNGSAAYLTAEGRVATTGTCDWANKDRLVNPYYLRCMCQIAGVTINPAYFPFEPNFYFTDDAIRRTPGNPLCDTQMRDVPKSWKKKRLIGIEDVTRMYFQQGVRNALYFALKHHSFWRVVVDLEHAEVNRNLAQKASRPTDRSLDTVDLSSASDSVGYAFVRTLLEASPIWKGLAAGRSPYMTIPGYGRVRNKMMATMGNATCFPIETIVFVLICLEANEQSGCRILPHVYGDDIVCGRQSTPALLSLLKKYGFTPNEKKTFVGDHPFRESCGGEFVSGYDVTPVRISRRFKGFTSGTTNKPKDIVSASCDLARQLLKRGYTRSYRWLLSQLSVADNLFPISWSRPVGIPVPFRPNGRRGCWNPDYQLGGNEAIWFVAKGKSVKRKPFPAVMEQYSWLQRRQNEVALRVDAPADLPPLFARGGTPHSLDTNVIARSRSLRVTGYLPCRCCVSVDERFLSPLQPYRRFGEIDGSWYLADELLAGEEITPTGRPILENPPKSKEIVVAEMENDAWANW